MTQGLHIIRRQDNALPYIQGSRKNVNMMRRRFVAAFALVNTVLLTSCFLVLKVSNRDFAEAKRHVSSANLSTVQHASHAYVTYLPHSGFHNQRSAMENALQLAYMLNRTLVLPPVMLFTGTSIAPSFRKTFEEHFQALGRLEKSNGQCPQLRASDQPKCREYTIMPWNLLFNFTSLQSRYPRLRIMFQTTINPPDVFKILQLKPADVFWLRHVRDRFQYYEDEFAANEHRHLYENRYDVPELAQDIREFSLIYFGSLFGIYRVITRSREMRDLRADIANHLALSNPDVITLGDAIVAELGGMASFISLHLRVGRQARKTIHATKDDWDQFRKSASETVQSAIYLLKYQIARSGSRAFDARRDLSSSCPYVIWLATDALRSKEDDRFKPLYGDDMFTNCINTLRQYVFTHQYREGSELSLFQSVRNVYDGLALASFLYPLVDAYVASRGAEFIGTPSSAFSSYIERLWRLERGVRRGERHDNRPKISSTRPCQHCENDHLSRYGPLYMVQNLQL